MKSPKIFQTAVIILTINLLFGAAAFAQQHKSEAQQESQTIKMATDLVSLSVTVADRNGKPITGLERGDFAVYENGIKQEINFFSTEEAPVSWGLVLDRSGSMQGMIANVYRAAVHVVDEGTEEDETFIVTFNKKVELVADFVADKHRLENSILGLRAGGETALWDAISFALDHLKQAKHRKRVLVVITDGEDNSSRTSFRNLAERVEEAGVLVYTVGMFESLGMRSFGMRGGGSPRLELAKLAEITGASAHFPTNVEECQETMRTIAGEVGHQYSLGYYPNDAKSDGKWRKLQVVVNQSESKTRYVARARAGYYAPKGEQAK